MSRQAPRLSHSQKLKLNASLASSIRILRFDASGLTQYLEEQARENPHLSITEAERRPDEWLPRWRTAFAAQGLGSADSPDIGEMLQSADLGLIAHVTQQIERLVPAGRGRAIAFALMESLEPSGWLGRPVAAIASEAGFGEDEATAILLQLQRMEPTGIFARSLAECLQLQAAEEDSLDSVMQCILDHLDLLAAGKVARLAQMCDVSEAVIMARLKIIRGFDPKPGSQFAQDAAPIREPDLTVRRGANGWQVSLNRSALPELHINDIPKTGAAAKDAQALSDARTLVRVVASRNETLLRIGREVLSRQETVLAQGLEALKPMTMREVGAALDLHESTISRAIAGVSVDTPRGTIWLRALFTSGVGGATGISGGAIRAMLLKLVQQESPAAPLGDQALADALSRNGAVIARRTVAKYRDLLSIPPAHQRKQKP